MPRRYGHFFPVLLLLTAFAVLMPGTAAAQTAVAGNKAVYASTGALGPSPSMAWIDASAFWTSGTQPDLCNIISVNILNGTYPSNYPNGAVIDARGLYNANGSVINCTGTPFANFNNSTSPPPTTILLPAAHINIPQTWVLPNNMKIVGEAQNSRISAMAKGSFTGSDIIDMGSSSLCPVATPCSGIAIEHLVMDATNNPILNGIVNNYAQSSSYVNDVGIANTLCAALVIGAGAANSGPYTNLNNGTSKATGNLVTTPCAAGAGAGPSVRYPLCIDIEAQTKGVHGVTCIGPSLANVTLSNTNIAGIYVNASSNTVEDLHFELYWDGVQIGDVPSGTAVANVVVSNVVTGEDGTMQNPQNTVHICGPVAPTGTNEALCSSSMGTVTDLSVLQSTYVGAHPSGVTSLQDDVTGTSIPAPFTGVYTLGESLNGGHSRFSTSATAILSTNATATPTAPTWSVGNSSLTVGATCTTPGDLYSNTSGGSNISVYVCTAANGWQPIA
jgi:hypothetical protein